MQLHLIAANRPYSGNIRGISGADYECHKQARQAGMRGTYRAFLSARLQNVATIVHYLQDLSVPIVNLKVGELQKWCHLTIYLPTVHMAETQSQSGQWFP